MRTIALGLILLLLVGTALAQTPFDVVAELKEAPGNIAVGPDGGVFVSMHQFFAPKFAVAEVLAGGELRPFPNAKVAAPPGEDGVGLTSVLGIRADADGRVWMLDNGGTVPKLIAWDAKQNRFERVFYFPPPHASPPGAFHNDLALDLANEHVYIADTNLAGRPAIVALNLRTGWSRRLLERHPSVVAEDDAVIEVDGKTPTMIREGKPVQPKVGLNPITIDPAGEWVYYGALNGRLLYRVRSADLRDLTLSADELGKRVARYGDKPPCDGISCDSAGNVYITDLNANGIGVTGADGKYRLLFADPKLSWPDAISAGPDGWMYVVCNQLHRSAALNAGKDESSPPFLIVRFKPLAESAVGR